MKHLSPRRAASGAVLALALSALWTVPAQAQSTPASAASASAAAAPGPQQFTHANGMTVIVQPDRRSPTAVQMVWVRVGSMDEVDGTSGVAHALEHMMFKGTPTVKARALVAAAALLRPPASSRTSSKARTPSVPARVPGPAPERPAAWALAFQGSRQAVFS